MSRMKNILAATVVFTCLNADTFNLKKGWNLVGISQKSGVIDIHKTFNNSNIGVVWTYHNGNWYGYSPDSNIENLISQKGMCASIQDCVSIGTYTVCVCMCLRQCACVCVRVYT